MLNLTDSLEQRETKMVEKPLPHVHDDPVERDKGKTLDKPYLAQPFPWNKTNLGW